MSCVKEKKNLPRNFHVSKKGKTADKVSCLKERRRKKLLRKCNA